MPEARRHRRPTTPHQRAEPIGTLIGRSIGGLSVIGELGRGGTAVVYLAEEAASGRWVALKVLHAQLVPLTELVARFRAEAEISQRIRHPGVVVIHGLTAVDAAPALIMELLAGSPLTDLIGREPLAVGEVLAIGLQVADAIEMIHAAGYAHRDIKPDNIMVVRGAGQPLVARVLDLGIALPIGVSASEVDSVSGTPEYMAPEQWRGALVDPRSDVYSLGCVLYEALTGQPPFDGSLMVLANAHTFRIPERLATRYPELPAGLSDLVAEMQAKDVADRPAMAEVGGRLLGIAVRLARARAAAVLGRG